MEYEFDNGFDCASSPLTPSLSFVLPVELK